MLNYLNRLLHEDFPHSPQSTNSSTSQCPARTIELAPPCMEFITKSRSTTHNLRSANNLAIPFSNSYYMKNSIAYRGAVIWNLLSSLANDIGIKAFTKKAWQSSDLRELNFSAESPSTIQHMDTDFVYLWFDFVLIWDRSSGRAKVRKFWMLLWSCDVNTPTLFQLLVMS